MLCLGMHTKHTKFFCPNIGEEIQEGKLSYLSRLPKAFIVYYKNFPICYLLQTPCPQYPFNFRVFVS